MSRLVLWFYYLMLAFVAVFFALAVAPLLLMVFLLGGFLLIL